MPTVRLLPYCQNNGPGNMGLDQAMLESAERGVASFRFYLWKPATLSLGYFQPEAVRHRDPKLASLPVVRRSSGGGAIVHDCEITYSMALPAGQPWQIRGESWICKMHDIVSRVLRRFNVEADPVACGDEKKLGEVLCFQHQTVGDLICQGHKVLGSAQRKSRGALLQHGSLLLETSPFAPVLPGAITLAQRFVDRDFLRQQVRSEFQRTTGWMLEDGTWTDAELTAAQTAADQYASDDWVKRR